MPKRPIIARTALPDKPPDGMTSPAGATARTGEARPTSTADHGTGHDLEDAHHPPPAPRGTAVTARRRSSRFSATLVRDRAPVFRRGLSVPVSRCADRCRGPLAPRSAPSRLARPRRLRPRVRSAVGTPAHPPADLAAPAGAGSPVGLASPTSRTVGTSIRRRNRHVKGSRAEPGAGGGQAPPEGK